MDFSQFNTKDVSEEGRALHLHEPYQPRKMLYNDGDKDQPCRILLRGWEARTVQDYVKTVQKKAATDEEIDDNDSVELAAALVVGFEHIYRGDRPLTTSREDLDWFFELSGSFVQQVLEFSRKQTNFLPRTSAA